MTRAWGWLVAAIGVVVSVLAGLAWWRERERSETLSDSAADLAIDRARRAREQAAARVEEAAREGAEAVAAADAAAAEEVDRACADHDLVDHLDGLGDSGDE